MRTIESTAGVCDRIRQGPEGRRADYLVELPHGATRESHFDDLCAKLEGSYPEDLKDFFFVNTDVGAPECGEAIARGLAAGGAAVIVLRCLIPRTFVDCNRCLGREAGAEEMTPAMPEYVRDERDVRLLQGLYSRYQGLARSAYEEVCGAGGIALTLHTYAPRNVRIGKIDDGIGRTLRRAYRPEVYEGWDPRPDVDLISEDTAGGHLAPAGLVEALKREYAAIGVEAAENATYRLHPETMGHVRSVAHPGRVLCMEINRALLADPFTPFEEMRIGRHESERMSSPVVAALAAWSR